MRIEKFKFHVNCCNGVISFALVYKYFQRKGKEGKNRVSFQDVSFDSSFTPHA